MVSGLLVTTLLAAGGDVRLASPGLTKLSLTSEQAHFFSAHLAARLSAVEWLKVITSDDISAALGFERQKQLLGCADDKASCVAELAGALGVDGLITGQVAKVGSSYQVNVKVIDTSANVLFVYSSDRLPSDETLLDELNKVAQLIANKLEPIHRKRLAAPTVADEKREPTSAPPELVEQQPRSQPVFWPALGVAAAGVLVSAAAAFCWLQVNQEFGALQRAAVPMSTTDLKTASGIRERGKTWQLAAGVLSGVGAAALAGGLLWYFLRPPDEVALTVGFDGRGGWVGVRLAVP